MKKAIIAISAMFIASVTISQTRIGIKAGINYFVLTSSDEKTYDYGAGGTGFLFGLTCELPVTTAFSVQPELNYSYQTAEAHYTGYGSIKLSYIQLPVLLKFNVVPKKTAVYIGPQFGFLTNVKSSESVNPPVSKTDMIQSDFGFTVGGGHVTNSGLSFDVRAYRGFMNMFKSEFDGGLKTRGTMFSATIGYVFNNK